MTKLKATTPKMCQQRGAISERGPLEQEMLPRTRTQFSLLAVTTEQERWAEAAAILKWQGENAPFYVAERIAALAIEGCAAGVDRFMDIAAKIDALLRPTVQ